MKLPITGEYPPDWPEIAQRTKADAGFRCIRCHHANDAASGHMLTVHHCDGNKSNCAWWNLLALCQKCHLKVQGRVNPEIPYFLQHSDWFKPYVAGFYCHRYLELALTRVQVMADLEILTSIEANILLHGSTPAILRDQYQERLRARARRVLLDSSGKESWDHPRRAAPEG